jgi:hypothetical protein
MVTAINLVSAAEVAATYIARKNGVYPYGITGTLANGSDAGMQLFKGFVELALTVPEAATIALLADGGVIGTRRGQPAAPISGTQTMLLIDQNVSIQSDGRVLYTEGSQEVELGSQFDLAYNKFCAVYNQRGEDRESASPTNIWWVTELLDFEWQRLLAGLSGTDFNARGDSYSMSVSEVAKDLFGVTFTVPNYGKTKGWFRRYQSDYPVYYHTFIGDGVTTTTTLDYLPASADAEGVRYTKGGVLQTYTTNYTVSTSTGVVTYVAAPAAGTVNILRVKIANGQL